MKETIDRFTSRLASASTTIADDEHQGLKKLAYPIERKPTGFYHFTEFDTKPSMIKPFETLVRRDETVLRCTTIAQDKFHHAYVEKCRAPKSNPVVKK